MNIHIIAVSTVQSLMQNPLYSESFDMGKTASRVPYIFIYHRRVDIFFCFLSAVCNNLGSVYCELDTDELENGIISRELHGELEVH